MESGKEGCKREFEECGKHGEIDRRKEPAGEEEAQLRRGGSGDGNEVTSMSRAARKGSGAGEKIPAPFLRE